MRYYRSGLPVPIGHGAHAGTWHAVLSIDESAWKEQLVRLRREESKGSDAFARAMANGARYSVNVYASSNLRLAATMNQPSIEPGSTATLTAYLTEYGLPVDHRARTVAHIVGPVGVQTLPMTENTAGLFTVTFPTPVPGTYHVRVVADGLTLRDAPFTREHLLGAVCIAGGDNPPVLDPGRQGGGGGHHVCDLIDCLAEVGAKLLLRNGISPDEVRRCLKEHCESD